MRRIIISILLLFATLATNEIVAENIAHGVKVVVIDAGHGGAKYPGASYRGVTEKSINLKVALKLGELIESRMPDVKVVYTRKTDMQFSTDLNKDLQARAEVANKAGGDVFISIHANAARSTSARGVETLIMGESPLEQRANESVLFANNKEEFIDMSNEKTAAVVRAYIQNLQFTYGEYSEMMARLIQKNYAKSGRVARGIRRQPLKVLYATDMPSVLTEIGFMSNPDELRYMTSDKGQMEIAENLYNAVKEYADFVRRSLLVDEPQKSMAESVTDAKQVAEMVRKTVPDTSKQQPSDAEHTANIPVRKPKDAELVKVADADKAKELPAVANGTAVRVGSVGKQTKDEPSEKRPVTANVEQPVKEPVAVSVEYSSKPAPVTSEPVKEGGKAFVVQIMASTTSLSVNDARFGKHRGEVRQYIADGVYKYKYCVGRYVDRESAQRAAMSLREEFNGAFVVEVDGFNVVKK